MDEVSPNGVVCWNFQPEETDNDKGIPSPGVHQESYESQFSTRYVVGIRRTVDGIEIVRRLGVEVVVLLGIDAIANPLIFQRTY